MSLVYTLRNKGTDGVQNYTLRYKIVPLRSLYLKRYRTEPFQIQHCTFQSTWNEKVHIYTQNLCALNQMLANEGFRHNKRPILATDMKISLSHTQP